MGLFKRLVRQLRRSRKCMACSRRLTSKKSIKTGFGSKCARNNPGLVAHTLAEREGQMRLL